MSENFVVVVTLFLILNTFKYLIRLIYNAHSDEEISTRSRGQSPGGQRRTVSVSGWLRKWELSWRLKVATVTEALIGAGIT